MKQVFTVCFFVVFSATMHAQDVRLNDSVIFINDKPVALYAKELNSSTLKYNMEVYNPSDDVLIKAEVIKFNAPVDELRPFYYYELSFPPTNDTFAIYIEDEAFPLVLAKIIRDYNLINKNELNRANVSRFIDQYYGGPLLLAKIKEVEDYLDETRHFYEQVKRDRTKPVTIIKDRIIMQDGKKIGYIQEIQKLNETNIPIYSNSVKSTYGKPDVPVTVVTDYQTKQSSETQIFFANGRMVDYNRPNPDYKLVGQKNKKIKTLYDTSKKSNITLGSYTDLLLRRVCYFIEEYAL